MWSATASMTRARSQHTATLLPSGKVLVTGGTATGPIAAAELFNPTTGTWSATGSMARARRQHTATLLPSGKVLVAGGQTPTGPTPSAELYTP
jgi:large repetitive protein